MQAQGKEGIGIFGKILERMVAHIMKGRGGSGWGFGAFVACNERQGERRKDEGGTPCGGATLTGCNPYRVQHLKVCKKRKNAEREDKG
jgi:hypothetical protein